MDAARADALYRWMTVDMPEWGREGWRRAQEMQRVLLDRERSFRVDTPEKNN